MSFVYGYPVFPEPQAARQPRRVTANRSAVTPNRSAVLRAIADEMTAALLLRAGLPAKLPGRSATASAEIFSWAEERYGATGATLRDVARDMLALEGFPDPGNTKDRINAAFSGGIGTDILTGVSNTVFMETYRSSDDSTTAWVNERSLENFKLNRRLRAGMPEKLAPIARGGTAEHVSLDLSSGAEEYRAVRYGRQFTVDEQDLVSQDLDAILQPFTVLGRGAAALKLDLVYSELMANAALADAVALFHASTHANLGTSAALASDKLDAAMAAMRKQTERGTPVNCVPRVLLVPPALEGLALRLIRDMSASGGPPLTVAAEPRLELGVTDPRDGTSHTGSATSWYLTAGNNVPTIEFGARTPEPVIVSWPLKVGQYGLGFSLAWDVGAKALDYRGLRMSTA